MLSSFLKISTTPFRLFYHSFFLPAINSLLKNHKKEALGNGLISESLLSFLILFIIF